MGGVCPSFLLASLRIFCFWNVEWSKIGDLNKYTYCTAAVSLCTLTLNHFSVFCWERCNTNSQLDSVGYRYCKRTKVGRENGSIKILSCYIILSHYHEALWKCLVSLHWNQGMHCWKLNQGQVGPWFICWDRNVNVNTKILYYFVWGNKWKLCSDSPQWAADNWNCKLSSLAFFTLQTSNRSSQFNLYLLVSTWYLAFNISFSL